MNSGCHNIARFRDQRIYIVFPRWKNFKIKINILDFINFDGYGFFEKTEIFI